MNKPSPLKWIRNFLCILLAILLFLSGIAYIVDPFMQFRVRDNAYFLEEWYVSGGLIKNYDYDTLILGSSVTQNFDMDVFRQELGVKPLHIGLGAMSPEEMAEFLNLAYDTGAQRGQRTQPHPGASDQKRYPVQIPLLTQL